MKKVFWQILITITFTLTACGQSTPAPQATPQPDQPTSTPSPFPTADATRTAPPSATPTASTTPLPTIPTFMPTFDASTIVTVTPAQAEKCPQSNPEAKLDKSAFQDYPENLVEDQIYKAILDYLNAGGSRQVANLELLKNHKYGHPYGSTIERDLTNDGVLEFIIKIGGGFAIYTCNGGIYESLMSWLGHVYHVIIIDIKDMNKDNLPEIVIGEQTCDGHCLDTYILEWNGQELNNLIEWETLTLSNADIIDINNDGVFELVMSGPFPSMGNMYGYIPIRGQKDIYSWNGNTFSLSYQEFSIPEYRFQAVQDADQDVLDGNFDKALLVYKDVMFNERLKWWSKARREHEIKIYIDIWDPAKPTPPSEPSEDLTEYPRLAAYAYYRIMLLHLVQGHETDASTVYNTLQEKFSNDQYGRPYVEMASAFWDVYQSTHRMYDGCAAAIHYATEHPEILTPLGSDYHGWQSHTYTPADVCPFR